MIRLGYDDDLKRHAIANYVESHAIRRVVVFGPERFRLPIAMVLGVEVEHVEWAEIILYRFYYRLLREVDKDTLLVINEPLRTQARHDLAYNCLRNFLQQTSHQIVFSRFPLVDTFDDFMILVDLDTRSRWRRDAFRQEMLGELDIQVCEQTVELCAVDVPIDDLTRAGYEREKRKLIDNIGLGDPHTIPRQLHLHAGKCKAKMVSPGSLYVGRNNRFKLGNLETYDDVRDDGRERTVFEFCHRFIDWSDFLTATGATRVPALVSELKVDRWYFDRFAGWGQRLRDAYATIHG